MIKAVVFDIGNVLIEWIPERYYDRTIGRDRREALFAEVDLHGMNERMDLGEPYRKVIYETAEAYPAWRAEIRQWHDNWIELAHPVIGHSVRLLHALRARGIPVFALTNFGDDVFDYARTQFAFLNAFDRCFVSGKMGLIKPDPEIYRRVTHESGLEGPQLLFADDRPENIAEARAQGWRTHLFEGPEGWAARLVDERLLSREAAA